jgi:hypothetical protein
MHKTRADVTPVIDGRTRHWLKLPSKMFPVIEQQAALGCFQAVPASRGVQVYAKIALTDLHDRDLLLRRMCDEEKKCDSAK